MSEFMPSIAESIFCCASAAPVHPTGNNKMHHDPQREIHKTVFQSFLNFASRRQQSADIFALILGLSTRSSPTRPLAFLPPTIPSPAPVMTFESLKNNPLTPNTAYVIHLTSRQDFGPVYSHRYFACPESLDMDWTEISLMQWFAAGESFKMKAEKRDLKCLDDGRFFRLTLRPNLGMRSGLLALPSMVAVQVVEIK